MDAVVMAHNDQAEAWTTPEIPGCDVVGSMPDGSLEIECFGEDMVEASVPTRVLVTLGWYPEESPDGSYKIVAYLGMETVAGPVYTRDRDEAIEAMKTMAEEFRELDR